MLNPVNGHHHHSAVNSAPLNSTAPVKTAQKDTYAAQDTYFKCGQATTSAIKPPTTSLYEPSHIRVELYFREAISAAAKEGKEPYSQAVYMVNNMLSQSGMGITQESSEAIVNNIQEVEANKISSAQGSMREVAGFAREAFRHLTTSEGNTTYGTLCAAGAAANVFAPLAYGSALSARTPIEERIVNLTGDHNFVIDGSK